MHHDTSVCFKPDKITKLTLCKQINLDLSRALYCATDTALRIFLIVTLLPEFVKQFDITWQLKLILSYHVARDLASAGGEAGMAEPH